jgi:hypothetical protein
LTADQVNVRGNITGEANNQHETLPGLISCSEPAGSALVTVARDH